MTRILSWDIGIVNLAYCILDNSIIQHWEVITLENTPNVSKLYVNLIKQLDLRKFLLDNIHTVLIEKQPSFNPKMRIISSIIQTYFYIRGVVDTPTPIKTIMFFSPKHKLKCQGDYTELETESIKNKSKYQRTKKLGILICKNKLQDQQQQFIDLFDKSKKKDDLADCFLQGLTYIEMNEHTKPQVTRYNKTQLKMEIKKYLEKYNSGSKLSVADLMNGNQTLMNLLNNLETNIKNSITEKYTYTFPLSNTSSLLTDMKLKYLLNLKFDEQVN